ncbi:MAG TPA: phosphatidylserine decarboxylase family protein [Perlabentimonas sp.]|jgi:phosphatidylserine decarboxylase|nr:phosphatidylserine decarboxylase family protein [Bacteroidales bacterium]MDD4672855.1 phosphatidylserine decarboxylase family protein [Bacteroidales bacterium]MDY0347313.1 phosphatidylserine decarboxylase family protein [Tenuifilaceae bacterium]HZJ73939.1 phosphatidylserine decarboxylase family protein [Perlabentimonas sp.]
MRIHKEGTTILLVFFIILLAICSLSWFTLGVIGFVITLAAALIFYIITLRFFRVPTREKKTDNKRVFAPCDGKVVVIEEVEESEFLNTRCIQISIFMSIWNVHINWNPIGGKVVYKKHHPGNFLVAWEPKSSTLNERTSIAIERPDGVKVMFKQIAGYIARRIVCYSKVGDKAKQNDEMGFIKFGSRVDVFIPLNSAVKVELNQKVVGTQTTLAVIPD